MFNELKKSLTAGEHGYEVHAGFGDCSDQGFHEAGAVAPPVVSKLPQHSFGQQQPRYAHALPIDQQMEQCSSTSVSTALSTRSNKARISSSRVGAAPKEDQAWPLRCAQRQHAREIQVCCDHHLPLSAPRGWRGAAAARSGARSCGARSF